MAFSGITKLISQLTESTSIADSDNIIVGNTDAKKITWAQIIALIKTKLNIGSTSIADIGDGTITGAIKKNADDIDGLNGKSTYDIPKISNNQTFDITEWYFHIENIGKIVVANMSIKGTMKASSSTVKLCTIPEKYRPTYAIHNSYCTQNGSPMLVSIFENGDVLLYNNSKEVNNYFFRQSFSWFIK